MKKWEKLQDGWRLNEVNYDFKLNLRAVLQIILEQAMDLFKAWELRNLTFQMIRELELQQISYNQLKLVA